MVEVLLARTDLAEEHLADLYALLPAWRQDACQRLRSPQAKAACVTVYSLLTVAWQQISTESLPAVAVDSAGKPSFAQDNGWYFSFSHRNNWVAVALGDTNLGVDINGQIPWNTGLFRRIASPLEQEHYEELSARNDLAIVWTRKEALAKKDGRGLVGKLTELDTLGENLQTVVSDDPPLTVSLATAEPRQVTYRQYDFRSERFVPSPLTPLVAISEML
ncbi:MAG: 4'-phosphopantetheinyl transferase family protein [Propionibacteriaceae bacterium]